MARSPLPASIPEKYLEARCPSFRVLCERVGESHTILVLAIPDSKPPMRRIATSVLLVCLVFAGAAPAYAKKHHVNKEARAAQKRNKARAKQRRKEIRAQQKLARQSTAHH